MIRQYSRARSGGTGKRAERGWRQGEQRRRRLLFWQFEAEDWDNGASPFVLYVLPWAMLCLILRGNHAIIN
jgi:hypothetical protein